MATQEKVEAVDEIAARFNDATAAVITEYRGLSMTQLVELRRALGEDTTYRVAKNKLVKLAAEQSGVEGLNDLFVGPTAIAFIKGEPVDAAKALKEFTKANPDLTIKGGYMDGRPISVSEVEALADLDSREITLGKLAGAMKAKLSETASLFAAPASQVARMSSALKDKKEGGESDS